MGEKKNLTLGKEGQEKKHEFERAGHPKKIMGEKKNLTLGMEGQGEKRKKKDKTKNLLIT